MLDYKNFEKEINISEDRDIISPNTYIKKEDFIKMIENLKFVAVKECSLDLITGFLYKKEENQVQPCGYKIEVI